MRTQIPRLIRPMERPGFHLVGNFAPVTDERENTRLRVTGFLPEELNGVYVRNGPNPRTGSSDHWFASDGMLHGIRLSDGRAEWYRNRYVDVERYQLVPNRSRREEDPLRHGVRRTSSHVIEWNGSVLAMDDNGWPLEIDRDLNTIGPYNFGGNLTTRMGSHTRVCTITDEMFFLSQGTKDPYVTVHRMDPGSGQIHSVPIRIDQPSLIHDFAITRSYVVLLVFPVVVNRQARSDDPNPYRWDDGVQARLAMLPRLVDNRPGTDSDIRWFDVPPGFVFHFMDAYEHAGDSLGVYAAKYPNLWRDSSSAFDEEAYLTQWIVDLVDMRVAEVQADDRPIEFPRIPPEFEGLRARYGYATGTGPASNTLVKYDLFRHTSQVHDFGPDRFPGETVFVRADGAISEDDGYVMTLVYDRTTDTSDLVILDGRQVDRRPLVTVHLEYRVPFGFHGNWIDDTKKPKPKTYYDRSDRWRRR